MTEQADLKRQLMEDFEAIVDRLLENQPVPEEITLRYVEQAAVAAGERVKAVIAQRLARSGTEPPEEVTCPACGKRLGMKDYRSRQVVTEAGEIEIRRAYYHCEDCKQGIFPPG